MDSLNQIPAIVVSPNQITPPTPPDNPSLFKKYFILVAVFLIIILIGSGGYFLNQKMNRQESNINTAEGSVISSTPLLSVVPATPTIADNTLKWTDYYIKTLDISIRYPADWKLTQTDEKIFHLSISGPQNGGYDYINISHTGGHSIFAGCTIPDAGQIKGCQQGKRNITVNGNTYSGMFMDINNTTSNLVIWDVKAGSNSKYKTYDIDYHNSLPEYLPIYQEIIASIQ